MWLRVEDTLADHLKIRRAARDLGIGVHEMIGHMIVLWTAIMRHCPDGDLWDWEPEDIEHFAEWHEDSKGFVDALVRVKLLDWDGEHYRAHDWDEYYSDALLAKRRENERSRQRRHRESSTYDPLSRVTVTDVTRDKSVTVTDVTRDSHTAPVTVTRQIREEKTIQDDLKNKSMCPSGTVVAASEGQKPADKKKDEQAEAIHKVFDHYRNYHPRTPMPRSSQKEWRLIAERLKDGFQVRDLCEAIDGCHHSPFHCGDNEGGKKYQALELIMRDAKHTQQFLELERPPTSEGGWKGLEVVR